MLEIRPARRHYLAGYLLFFLIIPLVYIFLARRASKLTLYPDRLVVQHGLFSRTVYDVALTDIRLISIQQSLRQRIFGIGAIAVATSGTSTYECVMTGIARPHRVKQAILQARGQLTS